MVPGGEEGRRGLHEVARPDEVVAAPIVVAAGAAPRDRQRGDERPGEALVLVAEQHAEARVQEGPAVAAEPAEGAESQAGALPLLDELSAGRDVRAGERLEQHARRVRKAPAERQREGERLLGGDRELADQRYVAVGRRVELPGHLQVLGEVGPAVAPSHEPAGAAEERRRGAEGERDPGLLGGQDVPAGDRAPGRGVPRAAAVQVGGGEDEHPELPLPLGGDIDPHPLEQGGQMRRREDLLVDRVAALRVPGRHAESKRVPPEPTHGRLQLALLLVEERTAVGDQELEVPQLRPVDRREVHLGDDPTPEREPETAVGGVGGPDAVLVRPCPPGRYSGRSERFAPGRSRALPPAMNGVPNLGLPIRSSGTANARPASGRRGAPTQGFSAGTRLAPCEAIGGRRFR